MKKVVALTIALLCAPALASTVTHCPLAADMQETKDTHEMLGMTEYNGTKTLFISSVYHSGLPVNYFKEVQLEPVGSESRLMKVKCMYVQEGGYLMEAYPVYPLVFHPPHFSTGNAEGPWLNAECNSQHPQDCLMILE